MLGGINQYGYVGAMPTRSIDPTGQVIWVPGAMLVGGLIGGLGNFASTLRNCGTLSEAVLNGVIGAGLGALGGLAFGTGIPAVFGVFGGVGIGALQGGINASLTGGDVLLQAGIGGLTGGAGAAIGRAGAGAAYWGELPVTRVGRERAIELARQQGNTSAAVWSQSLNAEVNLMVPADRGGLAPGSACK